MYWNRSRHGSRWCLVAEPPEYDGTNEEALEFYGIHDDYLLVMIAETCWKGYPFHVCLASGRGSRLENFYGGLLAGR